MALFVWVFICQFVYVLNQNSNNVSIVDLTNLVR